MKAIVLKKYGKAEEAFEIKTFETPALKENEVLIESEGFGLNYADVMARNGLYREAPDIPFVPGYEVVGRIKAGPSEWIGKRVIAFTRFNGYARKIATPIEAVVEIDDDVEVGEACALATQYVTAYYAAYEMVNLFKGDKVLIHAAAGGVGIALTQLAKLKGCEIYGTASKKEKIEFIKANGVDHPVNYKTQDYKETIKNILGSERIDIAFNSIGGSSFKKDKNLIGSGGRQVLYGGAERSGKNLGFLSTLGFVWRMGLLMPIGLMMRSKSVIGINMLKVADNKPHVIQRCMSELIKLYREDKISPHVHHTYDHTEIAEAHKCLESRNSIGKIAVKWQD